MAGKKRTKTRYVDFNVKEGGFVSRFFSSESKYDFSDIALLRKLLNNEKAKILYALKKQKPKSIYQLAKILGRDFKSVYDDLKLLERFGFIEFHAEKTGKRKALAPVLATDSLQIILNV